MTVSNIAVAEDLGHLRAEPGFHSDSTRADAGAVSWCAFMAGAAADAALPLILLI